MDIDTGVGIGIDKDVDVDVDIDIGIGGGTVYQGTLVTLQRYNTPYPLERIGEPIL